MSKLRFYTLVAILLAAIAGIIVAWLMPEKVTKISVPAPSAERKIQIEKNQCLKERDEALADKKNQENFFTKDLDDMILSQEEEKKKLVNGYEDKFIKTNSEYHDEKDKLLNELKTMQENFENIKIEHEKNIEKLNNNKVRLDAENKRRDIENEELKKEAQSLKDTLFKTKTKIEEIEEEMKNNDLMNLQWAKELETMSIKSDQIKRANTVLGRSCFRSNYRPES